MEDRIRISPQQMEDTFARILKDVGMAAAQAVTCARLFTENSLDGVYTHGVNRFPRFIKYMQQGAINLSGVPVCVNALGSLEQWDGQAGPGPLNALAATDRVMALAAQQGMGCVALAHTNHWMRGGTYGWRAAKKGFVFIGWTNTIANMPPWGALDPRLGNNPLVIAVPYQDEAIVLDMAMSQFSYGALEYRAMQGEALPVPGGYDEQGNLTTDPGAVMASRRILPIGYWKGAGMSLLLDILATILSGGLATHTISKRETESEVSQVFIAIDLSKLHHYQAIQTAIQSILDDYRTARPEAGQTITFPGERVLKTRKDNTANGIPVLQKVWQEIQSL